MFPLEPVFPASSCLISNQKRCSHPRISISMHRTGSRFPRTDFRARASEKLIPYTMCRPISSRTSIDEAPYRIEICDAGNNILETLSRGAPPNPTLDAMFLDDGDPGTVAYKAGVYASAECDDQPTLHRTLQELMRRRGRPVSE